ncbi:DUF1295 domain-containing protein [Novosphingobium umbonatum]|uniref:DUF1295 domain-containing protein n=1 Tax=Novosphingobium umbonatum TaxID=1908524 RepID=A0A437N5X2_9SPHN|nr:DUF1295 domain-containing protein [Novosphingobium umbonatum]RVU05329.1 DUF1295 domain-containing protein [Novosphingobium umbonatum]
MSETSRLAPPASDVAAATGFVGLAALGLWIMVCRHWPAVADALGVGGPREVLAGPYAAVAGMLLAALAAATWALLVEKVHRRPSTGLDWTQPRPWGQAWRDSAVKLAGLWATWAFIAFLYGLFRFYWQGPWLFALQVMGVAIGPLVLLSVPYVLWLDRVMVQPRDGAWHAGAWLLGLDGVERCEVIKHARSWAVKGFFTAFMLSILPGGFGQVVRMDFGAALQDPVRLADALVGMLFMVDVQIGTLGYLLTLRPLDAHIRSANPYLDGWLAALICYPPFVLMGAGGVLDYHPGTAEWTYWLAGYPALQWVWGAWLVMLTGIYAWATVAFGLRFSNLTYRGVITHGPYRLTRHPAYLSKNLFWWSLTLPFLPTNGSLVDAFRNTCILGLVSAVYWWRAKTEERHLLAEDAQYRAYWAWAVEGAPATRALRRLGF